MEFEYTKSMRTFADEVTYVNVMAKDGWELVTVVPGYGSFIYWFKRKLN